LTLKLYSDFRQRQYNVDVITYNNAGVAFNFITYQYPIEDIFAAIRNSQIDKIIIIVDHKNVFSLIATKSIEL